MSCEIHNFQIIKRENIRKKMRKRKTCKSRSSSFRFSLQIQVVVIKTYWSSTSSPFIFIVTVSTRQPLRSSDWYIFPSPIILIKQTLPITQPLNLFSCSHVKLTNFTFILIKTKPFVLIFNTNQICYRCCIALTRWWQVSLMLLYF